MCCVSCVFYVLCAHLCTRKRGRLWTPKNSASVCQPSLGNWSPVKKFRNVPYTKNPSRYWYIIIRDYLTHPPSWGPPETETGPSNCFKSLQPWSPDIPPQIREWYVLSWSLSTTCVVVQLGSGNHIWTLVIAFASSRYILIKPPKNPVGKR